MEERLRLGICTKIRISKRILDYYSSKEVSEELNKGIDFSSFEECDSFCEHDADNIGEMYKIYQLKEGVLTPQLLGEFLEEQWDDIGKASELLEKIKEATSLDEVPKYASYFDIQLYKIILYNCYVGGVCVDLEMICYYSPGEIMTELYGTFVKYVTKQAKNSTKCKVISDLIVVTFS